MTEPMIVCPNCKTEIKLTESLAAPLISATRKQFEQQLVQKDSDIAQREQAMRDKEKQLLDAKSKLDEQVVDRVAEQLKLFVAKYLPYLPSEAELKQELERERECALLRLAQLSQGGNQ